MSSVAVSAHTAIPARSALRPLARIESARYVRHPLFVGGFVLAVITSAGERGPIELDYQVIPAFFIGVLGIVVGARLTTSTNRSAPIVDSAPVSSTTRTAALCVACLVPTAAGLAVVLLHHAFVLAHPLPGFAYGTYGARDQMLITGVIPVIACAGGPLLGVAVGRWVHVPGAALLTVIVVLVWADVAAYLPTQTMTSATLFARAVHMAAPYTAFGSGDSSDVVNTVTSYPGSPLWFAVWTLALCAMAAAAALVRGPDRHSRAILRKVFVAATVVAVVALVLSITTGNQRLYDTSPTGTVPSVSESGG